MSFLSSKMGQYSYFALQLNDSNWGDKDILDFGGNVGNMLRDPISTIDERRYWCLDVVEQAIEAGRASYPLHTFNSTTATATSLIRQVYRA